MRRAVLAAIGIACVIGGTPSGAQTLQLAEPPAAQAGTTLPSRGHSMAQVEAQFGAPSERHAAVGDPPITRWVYPSFVVYFEYSHVVHAVGLRTTKAGTR